MSIDFRAIGNFPKTAGPKRSTPEGTVKHLENSHSAKLASDALRFSDAGSILQNAENLIAALPVVDAARVSIITESLDNGSYIVDAERVAEKIIEFEQSLSG